MGFMAAAPLVLSAAQTGIGVVGSALSSKEDTGKNIRDFNNQQSMLGQAVALNDYQRGLEMLQRYYRGYDVQDAAYQQALAQQQAEALAGVSRWTPVADAQAAETINDISRYGAYKDASIDTAMNIFDYLDAQVANEQAIANDAQKARFLANRDTEQMLDTAINVYRPAEIATINNIANEGNPAAIKTFAAAEDFYNRMKGKDFKTTWGNNAGFDAATEFEKQREAQARERLAFGDNPNSGVSRNADMDLAIQKALQVSGARTKGMQAGEVQDINSEVMGIDALNKGATTMNSIFASNAGVIQRGPMDASKSIFARAGAYNAPNPSAFLMPQYTSMTGQQGLSSTQITPNAPNIGVLGTMAQTHIDRLYQSIKDAKHAESNGSESDSSAGFGALAGMGMSGLTNPKNWSAFSSSTPNRVYGSVRVADNYPV